MKTSFQMTRDRNSLRYIPYRHYKHSPVDLGLIFPEEQIELINKKPSSKFIEDHSMDILRKLFLKWYYNVLILITVFLAGCIAKDSPEINLEEAGEIPTIQVITPVPLASGNLEPVAPGHIERVWVNNGEDKVTQDELRASRDPVSVLNTTWDGSHVSLFGGRNEAIAFNLVLEAPVSPAQGVSINFDSLDCPGGTRITTRPGGGDELFDFVGRDIELFFVRYLQIKGISTDLFFAGYDYDERHIPERCRLPQDEEGQGTGSWPDRPCHDLFYPDIAVPLELHSPFDIAQGQNQSIWVDVYIPKTIPAGQCQGIISISESGIQTWEVPVQLQVRDFTLPDLPNARTMLFYSLENISDRYLGETEFEPGSVEYHQAQQLANQHFKLAHRHKLSLIDSYLPVAEMDDLWGPRLDGGTFTPENGYAGIGVGIGNNVYSIGTYGEWLWMGEGRDEMWVNADEWVNWFQSRDFTTPTSYFLYLIDESDDYDQVESWATWMDENPGPGKSLLSLATLDLPVAVEKVPSLDIPTSWAHFGITAEWDNAFKQHVANLDKPFFMYNSNRPASGSFAIEDEGVALRELAWGQYKLGIDRWFYWESTYYNNFQCYGDSEDSQTNVFLQAQTYGCYDRFDESLGETGWNYLNGDGVLFYPGTDTRFPEDSYGVMGPFASLRLKYWRRGIQDVDYLTMAALIDPQRTAQIVQSMIPDVLWELGVTEIEDPTYLYADISWSTNPDLWETARSELADIIEQGKP